MLFFTETKKYNFQIHMEAQKIPDTQSNPEQKESMCIITRHLHRHALFHGIPESHSE